MKIRVSREELDECIGEVIAEVIKESLENECNTNESFDDDDTSMWDDLLDQYLSDKSSQKARKAASREIGKEMATQEHDDEVADEYDTFKDDDVDDDDETAVEEPKALSKSEEYAQFSQNAIEQAVANETNPYFRKALDAGVDPNDLYYIRQRRVIKRPLSEPDIDFMIKHQRVGKRGNGSVNTNFTSDFAFHSGAGVD